MQNPKNDLHELIKNIGHLEYHVTFSDRFDESEQLFVATARLFIDEVVDIEEKGKATSKKAAEKEAAQAILDCIHEQHQHLIIDWEEAKVEAQAGDALIKLCAYLSDENTTAEAKSLWLQQAESDDYLAELFDRMVNQQHPEVAIFGANLGNKKKATWVEAMIWRQFGALVISPAAGEAFQGLAAFLRK